MESSKVMWMLGVGLSFLLVAGCDLWPTKPKTSDPPNRPPTSSIVLPYAAQVGQNVTVQNLATDPDGDAISKYRFRSPFQDFTQSGKAAAMSFPSAGRFAVFVSAQDSRNAWSSEVSDTILISASPPAGRTLFFDDGTLTPGNLGYQVVYPANGDFRISEQGGQRVMTYNYGNKYSSYELRDWLNVPRGTHIKFTLYMRVDTDPVWETAADCRGYVAFDIVFGRNGQDTGAHYYTLATLPLLSDGFPGSPDKFENHLVPGKHVYDRASNGGTISRDIDLDQLVSSRYDSGLNLGDFNQIWFACEAFTFPGDREKVYRLTLTVDQIEVYVPVSP